MHRLSLWAGFGLAGWAGFGLAGLIGLSVPALAGDKKPETLDLFAPGTPVATRSVLGHEPEIGFADTVVKARKFMRLNPAAADRLRSLIAPPQLRIALPNGKTVTCDLAGDEDEKKRGIWSGNTSQKDVGTDCQLLVRNGTITGDISTNDGHFRIQPVGKSDVHVVIEFNERGFSSESESPDAPADLKPEIPEIPEIIEQRGGIMQQDNRRCDNRSSDGRRWVGPLIRVMVLYTPAARKASHNIDVDVALLMRQLQRAFDTRNFYIRTELAFVGQVKYRESGDMAKDLVRLAKPNDGIMDGVHAVRNKYKADLVSMITARKGYCGIAYTPQKVTSAHNVLGFSVVDLSCGLGQYSFAHEIGHNLGMCHDRAVKCGKKKETGFNYGFILEKRKLRSLMAYNNACDKHGIFCRRINVYSFPPAIGTPLGSRNAAHNAEVLCRNAEVVSRYR